MKSISLPLVAKAGGGAVVASGVITGGVLLHKHFEFPKGLDKELINESEASLSFSNGSTETDFLIDTSKQHETSIKVKAASTKSESKFTGDKWTCTIKGIAKNSDNSSVTLTDSGSSVNFEKSTQKEKFKSRFTANKQGFITSCAKNRSSTPADTENWTSEIVLLLKKENDKWIFEEEHVNSVFAGTWVNPETQ